MAYTFVRKTDGVDKNNAVDINELQTAIEAMSTSIDTMSSINATFMLSAAGATPADANGCSDPIKKTSTTNLVTYKVCAFDPNALERCWWNHPLPSDYNGGTVTYRVFWEHPATTTNFKVLWELSARNVTDGGAIDVPMVNAYMLGDTGGTTNALYRSAWSSPMLIAGTPAAGNMVYWTLARIAYDGTNDTLAVDAWLQYIEIKYTRA